MDLQVGDFSGWALLGSGNGRKLERFGDVLIERPSPQAIWPISADPSWPGAAAVFRRGEEGSGTWTTRHGPLPPTWNAVLGELTFEIRLTGFGNVGLFPEHAAHWEWMKNLISQAGPIEILNLFAYTGGASIVCASSGSKVTHVDSASAVNAWAKRNAELSRIPEGAIRYLADDALKFVRREERRGRRYHGIILDPPTFGRGTKGEVWKIERDFSPLIESCGALLRDDAVFFLITSHSPGVTPAVLRAMLSGFGGRLEAGEMLLRGAGPLLPAGAYARWVPDAPFRTR